MDMFFSCPNLVDTRIDSNSDSFACNFSFRSFVLCWSGENSDSSAEATWSGRVAGSVSKNDDWGANNVPESLWIRPRWSAKNFFNSVWLYSFASVMAFWLNLKSEVSDGRWSVIHIWYNSMARTCLFLKELRLLWSRSSPLPVVHYSLRSSKALSCCARSLWVLLNALFQFVNKTNYCLSHESASLPARRRILQASTWPCKAA